MNKTNIYNIIYMYISYITSLVSEVIAHTPYMIIYLLFSHVNDAFSSNISIRCEQKSVTKHCFIQGINTFHVDHLEAVAAKERMRNDVVPGILANLVA